MPGTKGRNHPVVSTLLPFDFFRPMNSCHPLPAGPAFRRLFLTILCAWGLPTLLATPIPDALPELTASPTTTLVYPGQTATFAVAAKGTPAPAYQWQFSGTNLPSATAPLLVLPNVTTNNAGLYQVIVSNRVGSVTSAPVSLVVLALPTGSLAVGHYIPTGNPQVPVFYEARGNETEVDFSIAFNVLTLKNPRFVSSLPPGGAIVVPDRKARLLEVAGPGARVTENTSRTADGLFGVSMAFDPTFRLDPGNTQVGTVVFDLVDGAKPMAAGLSLTNTPVAPVGPLIDGTHAIVTLQPVGAVVVPGPLPTLDFQSGLFVQRISVGNPGVSTQALVQISVAGLGLDSLGLATTLWNAHVTSSVTALPAFVISKLAPGETRDLLAEFYVPDLVTVPTPSYGVDTVGTAVVPTLSTGLLAVDRALYFANPSYPDGAFLIEFPTEVGRKYYVQYAPTVKDLNSAAATMKTALPSIQGTGSRVQWIDAGPPKTDSLPANGTRFYRVITSL